VGPVTLAKLHPDMGTMTVIEAELTGYWGDPDSDCVNGGVVRVPNGHRMMTQLASHHYLLMTGHHLAALEAVGSVFGIRIHAVN
jgi:hypothetical protein